MKSNNQALKCACPFVLIAGLFVALLPRSAAGGSAFAKPILGNAEPSDSDSHHFGRGGANTVVHSASTIPVRMTVPSSVVSGETFTCTVTVACVPPNGGYVQILCDTPGAVSNGSGTWPLSVYFAPCSSTTASFTLTAGSLSGSTTVNLSYGTASADPNNPADWTEGGPVTITPGC
jgi:hypothetical protein